MSLPQCTQIPKVPSSILTSAIATLRFIVDDRAKPDTASSRADLFWASSSASAVRSISMLANVRELWDSSFRFLSRTS
jgi:hypothetical protein